MNSNYDYSSCVDCNRKTGGKLFNRCWMRNMNRMNGKFPEQSNFEGLVYGPTMVRLHNGVQMPLLGLGTSHSGGYSHSAVVYALKECGYKLIDTAKRYGCETYLREAVKESGLKRDEIFLTTKAWPTDYGYSSIRAAFFQALERLGTEYLDLYMLHWPLCLSSCTNKWQLLNETWRALERLLDEEYVSAIGVSNCDVNDLVKFQENCCVVPHVDQMEFHPYHNPVALREYCKENKIQFQGYCPLGKGALLKEKPVLQIARKCHRTPAQVLIRWSIQNGVITIPKSTKKARVLENSQVFDFCLSQSDMNCLNNLHDGRRYIEVQNIQQKIDNPQPDGYKLTFVSSTENKCFYRNHS